jgi:hypothetical protein
MRKLFRVSAVVAVTLATMTLGVSPASAHEEIDLGGFPSEVGWINEPVLVGFPNAIFLSVTDPNGEPVRNLGDGMKVEISFGTEKTGPLVFESLEEPGTYQAAIIPTRPGEYPLHLVGTIRGKRVDVNIKIEEAEESTALKFPVKDPSTGELAERIDRELPRLERSISTASASAKDKADQAKLFGIIGIALGALGLIGGPMWGRRRNKA